MRAIDHMSPEELETLKLKSMLANRHTPYAANEDEAKDYELDRLEREQDIMDSEEIEHRRRMLEHAKRILAERKRAEESTLPDIEDDSPDRKLKSSFFGWFPTAEIYTKDEEP